LAESCGKVERAFGARPEKINWERGTKRDYSVWFFFELIVDPIGWATGASRESAQTIVFVA
jgi:hypothetical protein